MIYNGLASSYSFAYSGNGITDDKLGVTASIGTYGRGANKLEVGYSYLLLGERTLKINYEVVGTSCKGEQTLDSKGGIAIQDKITVDCNFDQSGVFKSHAQICSFDGDVQKSCASDDGQVTIEP